MLVAALEEVPGIDLPGGMKALHSLANVPKSWPLARLTIPLSAASKHLERLLEGCCNEIYVRNTNPDLQLHFVRKFAKDLVAVLAFHLAETIASLFRHVLHHPSKVLYDPETDFFFCCIAELAIKPCRSSRSKLRGEFRIPKHLKKQETKTPQSNKHPKPKTQHKTECGFV